jgi:lysine-N-methylase
MNNQQQTVLIPQYMKKFTCIGSECEDMCCTSEWRITIDEATYKKYKKCSNVEMKKKLNKCINRNRSSKSSVDYAKLNIKQGELCPLMDERMGCSVHSILGEEALSSTCATYPRIVNKLDNNLEKSGTLSCPEVARLALLNPKVMEFDEILESIPNNMGIARIAGTSNYDDSRKYFWDLRIFTIEILQNRLYSLTERLIFLGMFINKLEQEMQKSGIEIVPSIIGLYKSLFKDKDYLKEQFLSIPNRVDLQLIICQELIRVRMEAGIRHTRYKECLEETIKGLKSKETLTLEERVENYKKITSEYYEPFMNEREYILENYLVNYVFKNVFPLKTETMFDDYVMMIIHFAMIKLHLIGTAGYYKGLTEESVVKVIQSFARVIEHNVAFLKLIRESFAEHQLVSMASMAVLIKN